ncbi:Hypothetical protein PP7435_CHR3-0871 [Komagataella phaffii CBS 7435]|uniref:Endoplasmic reticulum lectin n=2 Tax=Komagataella phaffii TaxID=460519 RepID=C4R497_KOMPG|nr:Hypothetical protein PAS_chr3_0343 [Komagataella phaffii GS115]CAH2449866.1 Hypothetical protein BQ9382_C3-4610 [Komagataella phaffii CBS 7435]CAY70383.1 Hypothetical protein PAS_chr3_0343 [Komagataella phaffii GS115]CCA39823.1 Hypothetical protein PP7435_CHR3-0871 [Komagataella phaffii CBS 7435]
MVNRPLDIMIKVLLFLLSLSSLVKALDDSIDKNSVYTINYLNHAISPTSEKIVTLRSTDDQYFECLFNDEIDTDQKLHQKQILKTLPAQYNLSEIPELQTEINSAFNILENYNLNDAQPTKDRYWTYQIINGKLYQYNGNLRIVLANIPKNLTREDIVLEKNMHQSVFLSLSLQNGAICDLTFTPRKTNIRFQYVNKLNTLGIVSADEIQTCEYEILINVPKFKDTIFQYGFLEPLKKIDCYSSDSSMINLADYQISVLSHKWFLGAKDFRLILITDVSNPPVISIEELNLIFQTFPKYGPPELGITGEISPHDTFIFRIPVYSYNRTKFGDVLVEQNIRGEKRFLFTEDRIPHDTPNFRVYNGVNVN